MCGGNCRFTHGQLCSQLALALTCSASKRKLVTSRQQADPSRVGSGWCSRDWQCGAVMAWLIESPGMTAARRRLISDRGSALQRSDCLQDQNLANRFRLSQNVIRQPRLSLRNQLLPQEMKNAFFIRHDRTPIHMRVKRRLGISTLKTQGRRPLSCSSYTVFVCQFGKIKKNRIEEILCIQAPMSRVYPIYCARDKGFFSNPPCTFLCAIRSET